MRCLILSQCKDVKIREQGWYERTLGPWRRHVRENFGCAEDVTWKQQQQQQQQQYSFITFAVDRYNYKYCDATNSKLSRRTALVQQNAKQTPDLAVKWGMIVNTSK